MKRRVVLRTASGVSLSAMIIGMSLASAQAGDYDQERNWGGFYSGVELQLLKPYHSEENLQGFGHSPAWLGYLGYQSDSGLGVRARVWGYQDSSNDPATRYDSFRMRYLDLEATQAFRLGNMQGRVFGGVRFSSYRERSGTSTLKIPSAFGIVSGIEVVRPLGHGFSLFGENRNAYMFDNNWKDGSSPEKNMGFVSSEVKLGAEYAHRIGNSELSFFVRAAAVGQFRDGVSDNDSEATGLAGAAFNIGLRSGGTGFPSSTYGGPAFTSGFYSGTEISLVKPYHTEGQIRGYGFDPAFLGFLGYQTATGLGVRARWWRYAEKSSDPAHSIYDKVRMSYLDVEATQAFRLGALSGRFSGGLRLLNYKEWRGTSELKVPSAYGLVVGAEASRSLAAGFRLFGEARHAILFDGKWADGRHNLRNIALTTSELKGGIEYARAIGESGLSVFARAAATAQYWDGMSDADTESVGLWGAAFTVGLRNGGMAESMPSETGRFAKGIFAGTAISFLAAHHTEGQVQGFGFDPAFSGYVGYQHDNGLGMRIRGWTYTGKSSDTSSRYDRLRMRRLDLEATQAFRIAGMNGRLSGGFRLADYKERSNGGSVLSIPAAYGLVAGLELSRPLIGGLDLVAEAQHAIMFAGKTQDGGSIDRNTTFTISDLQLGLQYTHRISRNGFLYGRVAGTATHWGDVSDGDSESTSLFGVLLAGGLKFNL